MPNDPPPSGPGAWRVAARDRLLALRRGPGWGYRPNTEPCAEPTALAGLALLATTPKQDMLTVVAAAAWLRDLRQADGSVGLSAGLSSPRWPTALAALLWSALDERGERGFAEPAAQAARWLLDQRGTTFPREGDVLSHDSTIPGWSWAPQTHSWVEPTAWAVLALTRVGPALTTAGAAGSVRERLGHGKALLRDRALPAGGWNYGNTVVLGTPLRPQPAPTGFALWALAGDPPGSPAVGPSVNYLNKVLPGVRAAVSLAAGLLGLAAHGVFPAGAEAWLAASAGPSAKRSDAAYQLAHLLLAADRRAALALARPAPSRSPAP